MKLLITSGSLEAEIQGNPLAIIQKQLASISQKNEFDINSLRSYINKVSELKDKRIEQVYEEAKERERLEDMELEELRTMILSVAKDIQDIPINTPEIDSIKTKLESMSLSQKALIKKVNDRIERIEKDKGERIRKLQQDIITISNDGKNKILALKNDISNMYRSVKVRNTDNELIGGAKVSPHSSKSNMQDKLNAKPRMPI